MTTTEHEHEKLLHELEISQIELEGQNSELVASRQVIEESRERYMNLYDFAPTAYLTLDQKGTIKELNLAAAELLGAERHMLVGQSLAARFEPDDLRRFRGFLAKVSQPRVKLIAKVRTFDREPVTAQLVGKPARDRKTGELLFITAISDLSEVMRAEQERQRLLMHVEGARKELFEFFMQAPAPMAMLTGPEFFFTLVNEPFRKLVGRNVLGEKARTTLGSTDQKAVLEILDHVYQTGQPFLRKEIPFTTLTAYGTNGTCFIDVSCSAFRENGETVTGILLYAEDVTNQVLARRQLEAEKEADLEARANLSAAKLEAERANEVKSSFLANMSHEIRTPLGAILGFAELINEATSPQERREYAATILRNGRALTRIIDDILDLSKVEAGRIDVERIDFDFLSLVENVIDLFREKARAKNILLEITIDPGCPRFVNSDPTRLRQILINLTGNAIKFTERGSVSMRVEPILNLGGLCRLRFHIKDTGIGMTADQGAKLFTPFSQADNSTTRKFGGSGLGLALSRRLAQALGGDVRLQKCEVNNGCTFTAEVEASEAINPLALAHEKTSAPASPPARAQVQPRTSRILLAEDSSDNQALVGLLLRRLGMTVDIADNGAQAVAMAQAKEYDVVLMDMQMPVLDGYGATERLRKGGYNKPIVALTAHAMVEDRSRTAASGCDAHLTKPLDSKLLVETIDRLMQ